MSHRLLVVSATPPIDEPTLGGNHRYLLNLLRVADAADRHVVADAHPAYASMWAEAAALGITRHEAPFCSDPQAATERLDHLLADLAPATVWVNGHQGWLAPALLASRRLPQVPRRIFTMHMPLSTIDASLMRYVPGTWTWRANRADKRFLGLFNRVLSVSERFGRDLVAGGFLSADCLRVIPNGVDLGVFAPSTRTRPFIIGSAGNLATQKRFDLLIEAFVRVARPGVELHIAGEGPLRNELSGVAQWCGVGDRVRFLGFQRDMAAFYRGIDAFVLSSEGEAAPYVALEAAACGLPMVLTDVGDIRHWFRDGGAIITPPGDVAALASGMARILNANGLQAREVAECYSHTAWESNMRAFLGGIGLA